MSSGGLDKQLTANEWPVCIRGRSIDEEEGERVEEQVTKKIKEEIEIDHEVNADETDIVQRVGKKSVERSCEILVKFVCINQKKKL